MLFPRSNRHTGFSLVELIIVIGVIGLLLGLLLSAVQSARESSARIACLNNLKQIGLALHNHHDIFGQLPPQPAKIGSNDPNAWLSWMALILPEIEQSGLWNDTLQAFTSVRQPWINPPHLGYSTVVRLYICPDDYRLYVPKYTQGGGIAAYSSYLGVGGGRSWDGTLGMPGPGIRFSQITDGMSQTLILGERPPPDTFVAGRWYTSASPAAFSFSGPDEGMLVESPNVPGDLCNGPFRYGPGRTNNSCDRFHFWSLHPGGANFLLADGSIHFLPYSAVSVMVPLATRAGGEVIDFEW